MTDTLKIAELFLSLQGEGQSSGLPTIFIRLAGCNLRCSYCDTAWARDTTKSGTEMSIDAILRKVQQWDCSEVMVTGGEPLLQPVVNALLQVLLAAGYRLTLETNGSFDLGATPPAVIRSVDVKTPGSGEQGSLLLSNLELLRKKDQIKFVCVSGDDVDWSLAFVREYNLTDRCNVILQPAWSKLPLTELARSVITSGLPVRLGLQLHKLIWGAETQGV
ncbi:MAG: radical SAM protein [Candidatus Delongbacteria bacterium]|nr:radical SAM protein [Candidatus Delongbacteria bacterium]